MRSDVAYGAKSVPLAGGSRPAGTSRPAKNERQTAGETPNRNRISQP